MLCLLHVVFLLIYKKVKERNQRMSLMLDIIQLHLLRPVIDAFIIFPQDQQFALAVEYSRHAELVALQIAQAKKSSPGPALRLLKLTPAGVRHVTTHYLRCQSTNVVLLYISAQPNVLNPRLQTTEYVHNIKFIIGLLNFYRVGEAQLLGRAYNCSVDWGAALYHQYVKFGQETYLTEYLATFRLSSQILLQVVNK